MQVESTVEKNNVDRVNYYVIMLLIIELFLFRLIKLAAILSLYYDDFSLSDPIRTLPIQVSA